MEQNLVSDEELIERINKVLHESNLDKKKHFSEARQRDISVEKFHDVYETTQENSDANSSEGKVINPKKNLAVENHFLSLQLQAEKKKSKELQSKFQLLENSVKYFERLNGQFEDIKKTIDGEYLDTDKGGSGNYSFEAMQKIRPKTIHTAASGIMTTGATEGKSNEIANFSEPQTDEVGNRQKMKDDKDEVVFRDAEDFKQLEQGLEIIKDAQSHTESEMEKVYITKTEKRCLEDIGNLATRTRAPLDDKHQRFFEKDRRKFANSIAMPELQEVEKSEIVPAEIISKTKETPVNITSTELDGLTSYLLQLKELIARRETAWARTTERDYNQRVEITRFKNEVSHLRMLCEKRQKDIKERDQVIASKDEEIRDLQKRIQSLKNAIMKLEKKDDRFMETIDGMTNEVLENSHLVQKSYNAMKKQSLLNRSGMVGNMGSPPLKQSVTMAQVKPANGSKDLVAKKPKLGMEKTSSKKIRGFELAGNDDEKFYGERAKQRGVGKEKKRSESVMHRTKENYDKVDEKLQRVEEMLHNEVLKGTKRMASHGRVGKNQTDIKSLIKNHLLDKNQTDFSTSAIKKLTPSNSTIRQEMLTAMTGLNTNSNLGLRTISFPDPKKTHGTAAVIANALLAARNANMFNY